MDLGFWRCKGQKTGPESKDDTMTMINVSDKSAAQIAKLQEKARKYQRKADAILESEAKRQAWEERAADNYSKSDDLVKMLCQAAQIATSQADLVKACDSYSAAKVKSTIAALVQIGTLRFMGFARGVGRPSPVFQIAAPKSEADPMAETVYSDSDRFSDDLSATLAASVK